MQKENYIGIDIGGMSAKIGIVNNKGKILQKTSVDTLKTTKAEDIITEYMKPIRNWIKEGYAIKAIGVAFPGFFDQQTQTIKNSENIPALCDVPILKYLTQEFNIPAFADNDATVAAIGEFKFGIGKNFKNFLFITVGTGIGGGLILNNKVYRGNHGFAGEIGHMVIVPEGRDCACGNKGCIERYSSATAIIKEIKDGIKKGFIQNYAPNEEITAKLIFEKARQGDPYSLQAVESAACYLGKILGSINNLLNLEAIIIGGGIAAAGQFFIDKVKYYTDQISWHLLTEDFKILPASLLNDAGIIGAACLALEEIENKK